VTCWDCGHVSARSKAAFSAPRRCGPSLQNARIGRLPVCVRELSAPFRRDGAAVTAAAIRQVVVSDPAAAMRRDQTATNVAIVTGVIFVFAGLVKFVFHGWELHAFRAFGLPWPAGLEILAGVVETVGGTLLALRLLVVPVTLTLAVTMVVAIGASGVGHGDVIPSLTLAPALLLATVFVLVRAVHRD
jgi:uncharacterized membrane protein YphA (DoxX/SURF4 family)